MLCTIGLSRLNQYRLSVTVNKDKAIKATDSHKHILMLTMYQAKIINVTDSHTAGRDQFLLSSNISQQISCIFPQR